MPRLMPAHFPSLIPSPVLQIMVGVLIAAASVSAQIPAWAQNSPVAANNATPVNPTNASPANSENANPDSAPDDPSPVTPGADNPGSDDADGGANDDPVWGYFLGKGSYIFFREVARAISAQDGMTSLAGSVAKQEQLTDLLIIAEGKKHFGGTALADAVSGWVVSWRQGQQPDPITSGGDATNPDASGADAAPDDAKPSGWDAANLSMTQMSDLLCALYGSDPAHFHGLIDSGDIKHDAAESCTSGYRKLKDQWLPALHQAGIGLAIDKDETFHATGLAGLVLEQRPSTAPELADFTNWLHDVDLGDNLLVEINRDLLLVDPVKVLLLQCGKDNPAVPQKNEAPICYEWLKSVYDAATAQNVEAPPE